MKIRHSREFELTRRALLGHLYDKCLAGEVVSTQELEQQAKLIKNSKCAAQCFIKDGLRPGDNINAENLAKVCKLQEYAPLDKRYIPECFNTEKEVTDYNDCIQGNVAEEYADFKESEEMLGKLKQLIDDDIKTNKKKSEFYAIKDELDAQISTLNNFFSTRARRWEAFNSSILNGRTNVQESFNRVCEVCNKLKDDVDAMPHELPCLHVVHDRCIKKHAIKNLLNKFECPICKAQVTGVYYQKNEEIQLTNQIVSDLKCFTKDAVESIPLCEDMFVKRINSFLPEAQFGKGAGQVDESKKCAKINQLLEPFEDYQQYMYQTTDTQDEMKKKGRRIALLFAPDKHQARGSQIADVFAKAYSINTPSTQDWTKNNKTYLAFRESCKSAGGKPGVVNGSRIPSSVPQYNTRSNSRKQAQQAQPPPPPPPQKESKFPFTPMNVKTPNVSNVSNVQIPDRDFFKRAAGIKI